MLLFFLRSQNVTNMEINQNPKEVVPAVSFFLGSLSLIWLAVREQQMPGTQTDRQRWKARK